MRWFKKEAEAAAPQPEKEVDYFYTHQSYLSDINSSYFLSVKHVHGSSLYLHSPGLAIEVGIYFKGSYKRINTHNGGDIQSTCKWALHIIKSQQQRTIDLMAIDSVGDDWVDLKPSDNNGNNFVVNGGTSCISFAQVVPQPAPEKQKPKPKSKRRKK